MTKPKRNPKKAANKVAQLESKLAKMKMSSRKATPFRDVGGIIGNSISKYTGFSSANGIGKWLGTGIGSIFGSGDYQMVGQTPGYNVLTSSKQIPKFSTTHASNVVCHREYLGDITGTTGFTNRQYPLNPGSSVTFPWLSTIAQNYQEYKIHGLIFEFRPLITDFVTGGAPGVVIMATNYNADAPLYNTKQAMENSEFATSVKPTMSLIHAVECAASESPYNMLFTRVGSVPAGIDIKTYDLGNFQFATQSNPVQNLGELWVSYCVEFLKPVLPIDIGGTVASAHAYRTSCTNALPLGTVTGFSRGTLGISLGGTGWGIDAQPQQQYKVDYVWNGTAAIVNPGILTPNGFDLIQGFVNNTQVNGVAPSGGATTNNSLMSSYILRCNLLIPGRAFADLSGVTVPVGASVDIYITEVGATTV